MIRDAFVIQRLSTFEHGQNALKLLRLPDVAVSLEEQPCRHARYGRLTAFASEQSEA